MLLGVFALFFAGFVLVVPGAFFGVDPKIRIFFGVMIAVYGAFRVFSGISAIRKAAEAEAQAGSKLPLNGRAK
jgi:hypothetical protein